jgi:transcriptional regulator with XRE-family HTH domain
MSLGTKIKDVRKKRGLSQGELAEKIGISTPHMNRLEKEKYQPSIQVVSKLAGVLEVSVDYLLSDEDGPIQEVKIQNKPLAEKIKLIDSLDQEDQQALSRVIDSMLTKKKVLEVVSKATTTN